MPASRRSRKRFLLSVVLAAVVTPGAGGSPGALAPEAQKQVLVLYATRRDAQLVTVGDRELPRILAGSLSTGVDYYSEVMDQARYTQDDYKGAFRSFLDLKYEGHRFDVVIAMGGDGTFREVASALVDSAHRERVAMAMAPTGTANDQGRSFGLSADDDALEDNLRVAVASHETRLDGAELTTMTAAGEPLFRGYFFDSAAWGLSARILAQRNEDRALVQKVPIVREIGQATRFADPAYAEDIANRYLDLVTAHGTTTVCTYATIHPASVDAIFQAAQARGLRLYAGKTCMDRNAPEALRDTAQSAYDDSRRLLEKWHGVERLNYVITPRFSPTSTPEQLAALGQLWREYPDCLMQTHLSEQTDEIAWVKDLFPQSRDYLDRGDGIALHPDF